MTKHRFQYCLDALRLSQRSLARMLGCSDRLPSLWGIGKQSVPPVVADWLERCVAVRKAHPEPPPPSEAKWRRR